VRRYLHALHLPVHLDTEVEAYLSARAKAHGIDVGQLVNEPLRKDIELIKAARQSSVGTLRFAHTAIPHCRHTAAKTGRSDLTPPAPDAPRAKSAAAPPGSA
jgi:hypothetical protein